MAIVEISSEQKARIDGNRRRAFELRAGRQGRQNCFHGHDMSHLWDFQSNSWNQSRWKQLYYGQDTSVTGYPGMLIRVDEEMGPSGFVTASSLTRMSPAGTQLNNKSV